MFVIIVLKRDEAVSGRRKTFVPIISVGKSINVLDRRRIKSRL
jgi:hypothetical protein